MTDFRVKTVIDTAFELLGVKSTDTDLPAYQESKGLSVLNDRLAAYTNAPSKLPYGRTLTFDTVVGQQVYEVGVGKAIDSERIVYIPYLSVIPSGNLIYPLVQIDRATWYTKPRSTTQSGRPTAYYIEQDTDFSKIFLSPVPNAVYTMEGWGKFEIPDVGILDDLAVYLPKNWREFVKYDLANSLFAFYPTEFWNATKQQHYRDLQQAVQGASDHNIYPGYDGTLTACTTSNRYYGWYPF